MLNKAPTVEELTTQMQRGEIIAQGLARQRDDAHNKVAMLEADLIIERHKTQQQAQELESLRKEVATLKAPDQAPGDPQE